MKAYPSINFKYPITSDLIIESFVLLFFIEVEIMIIK